MGGGRYSTNNRVNAAAARAAAARASTPVISDPVVNLPVRSAVRPVQEEVVSLASPFDFSGLDFSNLDFSGLDLPDISPTASYTPPVAAPSSTEFTMVDITDGNGKVIGQSRQPVVTGGGGAKFYSDMSMAERRVVDEARDARIAATELRREEQRVANPDFDLVNFYENKLASADTSAEAKRKVLTAHDPNRGELFGTTPSGYLLDQQVGDPFIEAVRTYEVPLTQKADSPIELDYDYGYDADNLYMKQPPLQGKLNLQQGFTDEEREQYRDLMDRGSFIDISGGTSKVGEYSMVWVEDPPEPSGISKFLNNPILSVIGALNPVVGLATTAAKAATGEKLSPLEIATSMLTGLEMAGTIKAPVAGSSVAPAGGVGPVLPSQGTGLFGSTYGQTKAALTAAAAGDAKGAAVALVGTPLLKEGLGKVGLDKEAIENAGIQYDDFEAGLNKVVSEVAGGTELDEALLAGVGKYITEGGTLGSIDLPETNIDLGIIEDVVRDVVRPIGTVATEVAKFVKEAVPEDVDKIEDAIRAVGSTTEDVVRATGSVADDAIIQPIREAAQSVTEPVYKAAKETAPVVEDVVRATGSAVDDAIIQPIREAGKVIDDEITQPIGDAFSALDTAVRNALPDIDLPSVDFPSVDLPSFDLGFPQLNINLPEGGLLTSQPSPTRTTDNLFKDELFKFKTEVGLEIEPLEYVDLDAPAENFFEDTYYEDPILGRSYNF